MIRTRTASRQPPALAGPEGRRRRWKAQPPPQLIRSIELEPPEWQPRVLWVGARQLCGVASFFFISFVFAYFYLRSLDSNNSWKIGTGERAGRLGGGDRRGADRSARWPCAPPPRAPSSRCAVGAARPGLVLLSVVLQVIEWTTLGFGAASGGYASVFIGWTAFYAVFTLPCAFWIETQVATAWRRGARAGPGNGAGQSRRRAHLPGGDQGRPRRVLVLLELLRLHRGRVVRLPLPPLVRR